MRDLPIVNDDGSAQVNLATKIAGEDITNDRMKSEPRYLMTRVSSAAWTTVCSVGGTIGSITVNRKAAGAITLYDSTSINGTIIAAFPGSCDTGTYFYNGQVNSGISISTSGTPDVTISFRPNSQ